MNGLVALPALNRREAIERAWQTRLLVSHERALEHHVARVLKTTGGHAAQGFVLDKLKGVDAALDRLADALARVMKPSLRTTARAFADRIIHVHKSAVPVDRNRLSLEQKARRPRSQYEHSANFEGNVDQAIDEFMDVHTAIAVVGISNSMRTLIRSAIQDGYDEDLSEEEIANLIVEVTSGEIGIARARRIARTETHAAAMYGNQTAAEISARDYGLDYVKIWLATEDDRTRPDHARTNRQMVALDDVFIVGGVEMRYPGDIDAPPEQIINCRCICFYDAGPNVRIGPDGERIPYTLPNPGDAIENPEID